MGCEFLVSQLPDLQAFIADRDPHSLPVHWGLGADPDAIHLPGVDALLGELGSTRRRLADQMCSSDVGFFSGIAQLAAGALFQSAVGGCEFEAAGPHHPIDCLAQFDGMPVHCEVKYWGVPRDLGPDGSWEAPVFAPGVHDALQEVLGVELRRGNENLPGRGRVTELREHYEAAARQLLHNDPDHEALRVAVVSTKLGFPGNYFEDVMRGEAIFVFGESGATIARPYDATDTPDHLEPTGLANRSFAEEVDVALWFAYQPAFGWTDAKLVGSTRAEGLLEALQADLNRRITSRSR